MNDTEDLAAQVAGVREAINRLENAITSTMTSPETISLCETIRNAALLIAAAILAPQMQDVSVLPGGNQSTRYAADLLNLIEHPDLLMKLIGKPRAREEQK